VQYCFFKKAITQQNCCLQLTFFKHKKHHT